MKSIAIDFDGTLCEDKFPEIGEPNWGTINFVLSLQEKGWKIILWTCRKDDEKGKHLQKAVNWCKSHGLEFDAVNENLPEVKEKWGGDTRKVMVDYYLDDKNIERYNVFDILKNA